MHETLAVDLAVIARICQSRGVRRLAVFGSAVTDRFDEGLSDVDFLVEFDPESWMLLIPTLALRKTLSRPSGGRLTWSC